MRLGLGGTGRGNIDNREVKSRLVNRLCPAKGYLEDHEDHDHFVTCSSDNAQIQVPSFSPNTALNWLLLTEYLHPITAG